MRENTTRGRPPPALALDEPDFDHLSQAPEPLVRAILMTLCDDDRVKAKALRYFDRLLRFESESQDGPEDLRSPTSGVPTKNPRKRRKTGDPKICVQCDSIFLEEENQFGICKYHAGVMQLFDETKIDIDWETADIDDVDTEATRADFPDAFRWLCCDMPGSRPGCRRGRHEANPELSRKGRESASQESSLDRDPLHLDDLVGSQHGTDSGLLLGGYSDESEDDDDDDRPGPQQQQQAAKDGKLRGSIPLPRRSVSNDGREVAHERRSRNGSPETAAVGRKNSNSEGREPRSP